MTKTNPIQQQLLPPIGPIDIDQLLDLFKREILANFFCHRVGIIQNFDASTQRATVQLVDNWTVYTYNGNNSFPIGLLSDCPVIFPFGNGGITYPIKAGDECLVLFNDRDLTPWQVSGGVNTPNLPRMHEVSDAIVLVGVRSDVNLIANLNADATELRSKDGTAKVSVDENDKKISIKNASQSLKDLIANLITILENLKTVNGSSQYPIDSTTATNLTNLQTQFNQLLK